MRPNKAALGRVGDTASVEESDAEGKRDDYGIGKHWS